MQIDLTELKRYHWFEDVDGNVYETLADNLPKDKDYFTYHVVKPCEYHDDLAEYTYHPEHLHSGNSFYQAMLNFNWFYNWMFNRMKKRGDNKTFMHICTFNTTFNDGELIVAMVNSGDYTLEEAIYVYTNSCERCSNVLAYKYLNGNDGYPEYSNKWKNCHTSCKFCENEEEKES